MHYLRRNMYVPNQYFSVPAVKLNKLRNLGKNLNFEATKNTFFFLLFQFLEKVISINFDIKMLLFEIFNIVINLSLDIA